MFPLINHFPAPLPRNLVVNNLHYSRKLLLQTPLYHAPEAPPPNYQLYPFSHPVRSSRFDSNVIMVLSILLCALICSLCISTLVKCMLKCSNVISQGLNQNNIVLINQQKGSCGVDKKALRTFPVIKCSKDGKIIPGLDTECVICLSEFEDDELVRILPKCRHGFHVMCIDKWLSSHTSCPTCRQPLVNSRNNVKSSVSRIPAGVLPLQREEIVRNYT